MSNPGTVAHEDIWRAACEQLQLKLSPAVYSTWIVSNPLTQLEEQEDGLLGTITSPTAFHSINIKKNLYKNIQDSLEAITGKKVHLRFEVGSPAPGLSPFTPLNKLSPRVSSTRQPKNQNAVAESLFSTQTSAPTDSARLFSRKAGLNREFTFTTFAVSSTNEMAHAAATAVSQRPGEAYNPLFLYGGVGVGKTHLMHAIGNNVLETNPEKRVIYLTSETFTNEIIAAIRNKQAIQFKHKYRSADILLVDDVQFIAGKNTVQEEFFHTFNALVQQNAQIVLTSDRPPHEISLLEDRLRSRFEAGLMIDIQQPSFELRSAILLIKAKAKNIFIPTELAQIIAAKVESARKIEGVIKTLQSEVELKKKIIDQEMIERIISGENTQQISTLLRVKPQDIIKTVANHYHIKQITIRGQSRVKSIVTARHVAMYLMKTKQQLSYSEIGRWFSNRDHSTVMHAVQKLEQILETDGQVRQDVTALTTTLSSLAR